MEHTISLNRNEQFLRIYRKGKRTYHRFFVLYYLPNGSRRNRLGLKVGKKLAKAVRRNRIRRLLKESYRLAEPQVRTGYDLIFVAREDSLAADSYQAVAAAVNKLLQQAGLLMQEAEGAPGCQKKTEEPA